MKNLILVLVLLLIPHTAFGQYGRDSGYWEFVENSHTNGIVRVKTVTLGGVCTGTGSVIWKSDIPEIQNNNEVYKAYVLTAEHVIQNALLLKVDLQDFSESQVLSGEVTRGTVSDIEGYPDICIMSTYVPKSQPVLQIATDGVRGDEVWICGYGGPSQKIKITDIRCFKDKIAHFSKDRNILLINHPWGVIQGDSGGPILNAKGQIMGVVSGGWLWVEDDKLEVLMTCPIRAGSFKAVNKLLEIHKAKFGLLNPQK